MTEAYLHHVWRYRLYQQSGLCTLAGEPVEVVHPGQYNRHAGPDFLDARIRISGHLWAGQVEIHLKASDWNRHAHQEDPRYANVILHVVWEPDAAIIPPHGGELPVLCLRDRLFPGQWEQYISWLASADSIACRHGLPGVDHLTWLQWKDRLVLERLERKASLFLQEYRELGGDWEEVLYRRLAGNMGFRVNAEPFHALACRLPYRMLQRMRDHPLALSAVLFGVSGWLPEQPADDYAAHLLAEFRHQRTRLGLVPMPRVMWNTGRIRPASHPCLRIAQFAAIMERPSGLMRQLLEEESPAVWMESWRRPVHPYWETHYHFEDAGAGRELRHRGHGRMGREAAENLAINTFAPALAAYGRAHGIQEPIDRAVAILEYCRAERNHIMEGWVRAGVPAEHAADSQALIQLSGQYCRQRKCLDCMIGAKLLRQGT